MKKYSRLLGYFIFLSLFLGVIGCQEQITPLEPVLSDEKSGAALQKVSLTPGRYIIVFEKPVNDAAQEQIIKGAGGSFVKHLSIINGKSVYLPSQAVAALKNTTGVVLVEKDRIVQIPDPHIKGKVAV